MKLRDLIPSRAFVIETSWPPSVAAIEIKERVGPPYRHNWFLGGDDDDTPFAGSHVRENEFRFSRRIPYRNSLLPVVHATVEPSHDNGARVHVRIGLPGIVMPFMAIWSTVVMLIGLAVLVSALSRGQPAAGLAVLAFPVFAVTLLTISSGLEARTAESLLRDIFARAPGKNSPPRTVETGAYR
jgi:hypothetical protein